MRYIEWSKSLIHLVPFLKRAYCILLTTNDKELVWQNIINTTNMEKEEKLGIWHIIQKCGFGNLQRLFR